MEGGEWPVPSGLGFLGLSPTQVLVQVSGIQVVYNVEAPVGSRVCSVRTVSSDGSTYTELEDERTYPMVVAMYIANGGDGHSCLADNK